MLTTTLFAAMFRQHLGGLHEISEDAGEHASAGITTAAPAWKKGSSQGPRATLKDVGSRHGKAMALLDASSVERGSSCSAQYVVGRAHPRRNAIAVFTNASRSARKTGR